MNILDTSIAGVKIIETARATDARGSFTRFFCANELSSILKERKIVQINHSYSKERGTIRGMHYQRYPQAEMKFVRCIRGKIWDVALDLRKGSPTFLKWHAEELTPENSRMLIIPEGCAHGVQTLVPDSEFLYCNTAFYDLKAEAGVRYDDPAHRIAWPLPASILSDKDRACPLLENNFSGLVL